MAVERVCAEFQSSAVHKLIDDNVLSEQETEVYKRSSVGEYRSATGLEALFGFLKLTDRTDRIEELFSLIWDTAEKDSKQ